MNDEVRCAHCGEVSVPREGDTCSEGCYRAFIVARIRAITDHPHHVILLGEEIINDITEQPWYDP